MTLTLTRDQQLAFDAFEQFLRNDTHILILRGAAGTGKTTLLKKCLDTLADRHRMSALMAPTGRAAHILREKTGYPAATIHRTLYTYDELPSRRHDRWVFKLRDNHLATNAILFVDEASMVADVEQDNEMLRFGSGRLLADLIEYCALERTDRKLVLVGDYAQLPPVMQSFSPALDRNYLAQQYGLRVEEAALTEVVRQQSQSAILRNATCIREAIDRQEFNRFHIEDAPDVEPLAPEAFVERYRALVGPFGAEEADAAKLEETMVVTHSNAQALEYNRRIRELLWGRAEAPLRVGDRLLSGAPKADTLYRVVFEAYSSAAPSRVSWMRPWEGDPLQSPFYRSFQGTIQIRPGRPLGFVGDVFVEPCWVAECGLSDGDAVQGCAVRNFDRKKEQYGWRVVELSRDDT